MCAGSGGDWRKKVKAIWSSIAREISLRIGMMSRYKSTHDIYDQKTFVALETSYFGHLWAKVILTLYVWFLIKIRLRVLWIAFHGTGQFFPRRLQSRYEARTNCVHPPIKMKLSAWCGAPVKATGPPFRSRKVISVPDRPRRAGTFLNRNAIEIQGQWIHFWFEWRK